jgi:hypothetical protein
MMKAVLRIWRLLTQEKFLVTYAFLIFVFLLARNPFGERTLIPNLEPYPDTFHYIVPARSFVSGGDFAITRGFGNLRTNVSPFYSFVLMPFYILNGDPRMFYFANVILSFVSFFLFYLILKKVSSNRWVVGFSLFLFATNFFIYWYPQWAMAENLILPLFLAGALLFLEKITVKNAIVAGLLSLSFFATKYAYVPLSGIFFVIYLFKLRTQKREAAIFIASFITATSVLLVFINLVTGVNLFATLFNVATSFGPKSAAATGGSWFSFKYLAVNLPVYLYGLVGQPARFLWDFTPIVPAWIGIMGIVGLISGIFLKKFRFLSLSLLALLAAQTVFIATFYAVDLRYIYHAIPTLLLGVVILLGTATKRTLLVILAILFAFYFLNNAIRIKNQIVLNLKYAETPWTYISVLRLNDFFTSDKVGNTKPVVVSSLPPYYIDYFSNGNYNLLPLSPAQEFRAQRNLVWGPGDYSDLHGLYETYLREGRSLFVATYGFGNEAYLHLAFDNLNKDFLLTEVDNGCYELCKIYKVDLRNAKSN